MSDRNPTILCVDDSQTIISFLNAFLTRNGFNVEAAYDGAEGLEKMKAIHPDAVLLDINMPKLSGFDVALTAMNDPALSSIPIIILSALSQTHNKERSELRNVYDYLIKPVNPSHLIETIRQSLSKETIDV